MKSLEKQIRELESKAAQVPDLAGMSPYDILGIDKDTSPADAKKQYRSLARVFHPDRYNKDAGAIFKAIEEAYRVLTEKPANSIAPSSNKKEKEEEEEEEEEEEKEEDKNSFFLSEKLDDYLIEPEEELKEKKIGKNQTEEDQTATRLIAVYDKDVGDEAVGRTLILADYVPYIGYREFTKLNRKDQKELAILLGRQKQRYCDALEAKYLDIDLSRISQQTINYNSVDLDSESFLPEERHKVILLSQRAYRSEHSLGDKLAITTEVIATDTPNLYLSGWVLLHEKPGITSGALGLFRTWRRKERKSLATAIGNESLRYSNNHLQCILAHYEKSSLLDSHINKWHEVVYDEKKHGNKVAWEIRMGQAFQKLPSRMLIDFVKKLKEFNVPRDDNYWYQEGKKIIIKGLADLRPYAFSLLSDEAQRYVAIVVGKKLVLKDAERLIAWANTIERAEKQFLEEIRQGRASIKESEYNLLSKQEKITLLMKESPLIDLNDIEPDYKEEIYDEKNVILDEEDLGEAIKNCIRRIPAPSKEGKDEGKGMAACSSQPHYSKSELLGEEKKAEIERIASPVNRHAIKTNYKEEFESDKEGTGNIKQNEGLGRQKLEDTNPASSGMDEVMKLSEVDEEYSQNLSEETQKSLDHTDPIPKPWMDEAILLPQVGAEYPQNLSYDTQNSINQAIRPQQLGEPKEDLCSLRQELTPNPAQNSCRSRQDRTNNSLIELSFFESISRTLSQFQSEGQPQYIVYTPPSKRRRRM